MRTTIILALLSLSFIATTNVYNTNENINVGAGPNRFGVGEPMNKDRNGQVGIPIRQDDNRVGQIGSGINNKVCDVRPGDRVGDVRNDRDCDDRVGVGQHHFDYDNDEDHRVRFVGNRRMNKDGTVGSGNRLTKGGVGSGRDEVRGHKFRNNDQCYSFEGCDFYQILFSTNEDYGCSKCRPGYELIEDASGSGVCSPVTTSTIANCVWSSFIIATNKHTCYQCASNYYLDTDFTCKSIAGRPSTITVNTTPGCNSYFRIVNTNTVVCQSCSSGQTLDLSQNRCVNGCNLSDCDNCYIDSFTSSAVLKCFNCKRNAIALYDPNSIENFSGCITCREWQISLLTNSAIKILDEDRDDDCDNDVRRGHHQGKGGVASGRDLRNVNEGRQVGQNVRNDRKDDDDRNQNVGIGNRVGQNQNVGSQNGKPLFQ